MTGNMLKLGACSRQRDSGIHPNSQCCRHKTTTPSITAWMVPDFKSWLTLKIMKVMCADNCIHYDLLVCFIKLIKPLCFFPSTSDKLYFIFSTEKSCWQFQASCQGLWMMDAAGDTGRGHLPFGGWVWGDATVGAHLALLAAVTAPALIVLPFPSPAVQTLFFHQAWFEKDYKPAQGMKGIATASSGTGREVTCIWHVLCVIPEAKPLSWTSGGSP